jgi:hypothetical protein
MTIGPRAESLGAIGWLGPLLVAFGIGAAAYGCKKESVSLAEERPAAAPLASHDAVLTAKDRFDEAAFALRIAPEGTYSAGKTGVAAIELTAKAGFKCNDQYPYKFKAKASPDIAYASPVVGKDALRLEGKDKAVMKVAFTPNGSGKKTVGGQFAFSVCTEEQCLVERRDLELTIDVK